MENYTCTVTQHFEIRTPCPLFVDYYIGRTYSTHTEFQSKICKRMNQYGVTGIDGMLILKWAVRSLALRSLTKSNWFSV
jgi:hypothetical protein